MTKKLQIIARPGSRWPRVTGSRRCFETTRTSSEADEANVFCDVLEPSMAGPRRGTRDVGSLLRRSPGVCDIFSASGR